jgi:DNA-directed RNA polymerase specialized sigma24 family protein
MDIPAATDADLLAVMADGTYFSPSAKAALGELFSRHAGYLYAVVRRSYGAVLDEDDIVDVVTDSFLRAAGWAYRLHRPSEVKARFSADTPDGVRRRMLGWFGRIAERLVMSKLSRRAVSASNLAQYLAQYSEAEETPVASGSVNLRILRAALSALSSEERDALTVSLPWYDVATSQFQLPRGEAASIARHLGVSPDLFRQRRHRALKHLREYFRQSGISTDADGGET